MAIGIKTRNFSPNKCENTFEKDGFGWAPGQEKKFSGIGINKIRYDKNYSRMVGDCLKCAQFTGDNKCTAGEHCKLPADKPCQF